MRTTGGVRVVEAAGRLFHLFRDGPDYAFTLFRASGPGCGACYPSPACRRILVPTLPVSRVSRSMSLYRAGLKLAFFLPLGVAMPSFSRKMPSGFTDVSSVINQPSRVGATLDRTPVRKR